MILVVSEFSQNIVVQFRFIGNLGARIMSL